MPRDAELALSEFPEFLTVAKRALSEFPEFLTVVGTVAETNVSIRFVRFP